MTIERQDIIEDFYVGVNKNIRDTIYDKDGNLLDLTGGEATFFLMDAETGVAHVTKSSSDASEIEILDQGTNQGELIVYLVPSDTRRANDANLYGTFRYQIYYVDASDMSSIVTTGKINIFPAPQTGRFRHAEINAYLAGQ
jgi:hypothetical protein